MTLRVALAQLRNAVGDIEGNTGRIAEAMGWAEDAGADVLVLPELVLTGYPLGDLVLHREFVAEAEEATAELAARSGDVVTVLSTVTPVPPRRSWDSVERSVSISAVLLSGGEERGRYHKVFLPTHGAYDEGKNFAPGRHPGALWRIGDVTAGVAICEDLWSGDGPPEAQSRGGARILFAPNASPYQRGKAEGRRELTRRVARRNGMPIVYANLVGGHDELVFDGGSLIVDAEGELCHRGASFDEDRLLVDVPLGPARPVAGDVTTVHTRPRPDRPPLPAPEPAEADDDLGTVWRALVTGTRDFARKNGFRRAVVGLSGGLDAALTAAVAAEALGPEQVLGVAMPAEDTDDRELVDARQVAETLGIRFACRPLGPALRAAEVVLGDGEQADLSGPTASAAEARIRAALLNALAEQDGDLVLATGNKTELSLGGAVLHGDMVGGFAPLKDCTKTLLYELARHHDQRGSTVVPTSVIEKQTTAQQDAAGDLPPYRVLDTIVERYVQFGEGVEDLIREGLDSGLVVDLLRRIDAAEFKRRQVPPGVRISAQAFGTDLRMPISNGWRAHRRGDTTPASAPDEPRFDTDPETEEDLPR